GALAAVGLADVERRGVVLMNDDPRIQLSEVGIGIGSSGGLEHDAKRIAANGGGTDADDEHARRLEERAARRRVEGVDDHAPTVFPAIALAARLMAICTR